MTGFGLANPKLFGERDQARQVLRQPTNRSAPGTAMVTDKGLSGEDTEAFFANPDLDLTLIRPARKDALTCPKQYLQFRSAQGAAQHCEAGARTLFHQHAFDWLDQVLSRAHAEYGTALLRATT
jgi:hypothetical protein